jgi:hypothetical protein
MARDDWRLRIDLADEVGGNLLGRLGLWESDAQELAHDLKDRRLVVTRDDDTVFVYASSSLELEQARIVIERELEDLDAPPLAVAVEHWLSDEERWDDEAPGPSREDEVLAEGYAPWEVRVSTRSREAARELANQLAGEGYGVVRRWNFVIAGCATREQAVELAARVHGQVEAGGELVWETLPGNPFAIFGGIGDAGGPI